MLCCSSFFVPLEYAGVFKDVREDNANFVVDVLLELLGRKGRAVLLRSGILARTVALLKQLGVDLASPIGVRDGGGVRS